MEYIFKADNYILSSQVQNCEITFFLSKRAELFFLSKRAELFFLSKKAQHLYQVIKN